MEASQTFCSMFSIFFYFQKFFSLHFASSISDTTNIFDEFSKISKKWDVKQTASLPHYFKSIRNPETLPPKYQEIGNNKYSPFLDEFALLTRHSKQ